MSVIVEVVAAAPCGFAFRVVVSPALAGESRKAEVSTVGETFSNKCPEVMDGNGE